MKDLVFKGENNQALTNSLLVAEKFGKNHQHVMRDIRKLIQGMSKIGHTPLFEETTYINPQNGQEYPMYVMNRDGFSLLAMGFTGKKALQFKVNFINAFNKMEQALATNQYQVPQSFSEALMLAAHQQDIIEEQQREIAQQKQIVSVQGELIEVMKPKVTYCDVILQSKSTTNITTIAQDYGMCPAKFNKLLHELGIQHKVGNQWVLYRQYIDKGYVQSTTHTIENSSTGRCFTHTTWTQKGRQFIYDTLKSNYNILPLIEKGESA